MNRVSVTHPELLHIRGENTLSYGATQLWYSVFWRRRAGCGPTAASNLIWYLAATQPGKYGCLYDGDCRNRHEMIFLMNMWMRMVTLQVLRLRLFVLSVQSLELLSWFRHLLAGIHIVQNYSRVEWICSDVVSILRMNVWK